MDGDEPFGVHFTKINNIPRTDYISNDHGFDSPQSQKSKKPYRSLAISFEVQIDLKEGSTIGIGRWRPLSSN